MERLILTVTGPSGSGKTELVRELCDKHSFAKLISVTTRPKRPGEIEGQDYYFISEEEFIQLEQNKGLAQEAVFNGFRYGTTVAELERVSALGKIPIVIVEPGGIPQFERIANEYGYKLLTIFIEAEGKTLIKRYLSRISTGEKLDRLEYHARRIAAISDELKWKDSWDFDMCFHNNSDDLADISRFANIIGEFCGQSRNAA
jgi:Guanylate kinase